MMSASADASARQRLCASTPLPVRDHHHNAGLEGAHRFIRPLHTDKALAVFVLELFGDAAVGHVHHQTFTAAQITDDGVSGNGAATSCELHRRVFAAIQGDGAQSIGLVCGETLTGKQQGVRPLTGFAQQVHHALGHDIGDALAQTDVGQQLVLWSCSL